MLSLRNLSSVSLKTRRDFGRQEPTSPTEIVTENNESVSFFRKNFGRQETVIPDPEIITEEISPVSFLRKNFGRQEPIIETITNDLISIRPNHNKTRRNFRDGGSAITTDATQDGLLADLKFGFEFRQKYALNNNLYGNNQHATPTGSLSSVGLLDTVGLNCSNSSYLTCSNTSENRFGAKDWSIAFLFYVALKWTGIYTYNVLFANEQFENGRRVISAAVVQPSLGTYTLECLVNYPILVSRMNLASNNSWYLAVANHDNTAKTLTTYVSNALAQTSTYTGSLSDNSDPFYIGTRNNPPIDNSINYSRLQYIYKWDRVLTSPERDWLYNSGGYRFLSN
jgi:hypothetical protein